MTGFARADGEADGIAWVWELKSVNSRTLDLRLRLPPGFDPLEAPLRAGLAEPRSELAALVETAAGCAAAQPAALQARLQKLLGEFAGLAPAMPQERVAQELALLVTRADIREELDRLRAHIAQAGELL